MPTTPVLLAALGLLTTPAAAAASTTLIVPGSSIGRVAIGDERAVVEGRVGPGHVVATYPGPTPSLPGQVVSFASAGLVAAFGTPEASAQADLVATRSPRYRTATGIGVGSPIAAVRAAYPGLACAHRVCGLLRISATGEVRVTRLAFSAARKVVKVAVYRVDGPPGA